eukprot:Em0582g1a
MTRDHLSFGLLIRYLRSEVNFDKLSLFVAKTQGITYDFDSIMHYLPNAFSVNGKVTVMPQDRGISLSRLGQRVDFSPYDLQHVNALYCSDGTTATWGSWSSWTTCSQTCNGGVRTRTRVCEGGSNCVGSNIDTEQCNTAACPVAASWAPWGAWGACSASCGGGRQQRVRACHGGNICKGPRTEFRDCNIQSCSSVQVDTPLKVTHKGCFYLSTNNVRLGSLESSTLDLSDNPRSRMNAVVKCQQAAQQFGFEIFAISLGYCISGSNRLSDYQLNPASDDSCHNGLGGWVSGHYAMDLYQIITITNTITNTTNKTMVATGAFSDQVPRQSLAPIPLINTTGPPLSHDVVDTTVIQDPSSSSSSSSSGMDQQSTPCALLLLLLIVMGTSNAVLDIS